MDCCRVFVASASYHTLLLSKPMSHHHRYPIPGFSGVAVECENYAVITKQPMTSQHKPLPGTLSMTCQGRPQDASRLLDLPNKLGIEYRCTLPSKDTTCAAQMNTVLWWQWQHVFGGPGVDSQGLDVSWDRFVLPPTTTQCWVNLTPSEASSMPCCAGVHGCTPSEESAHGILQGAGGRH
jgi:hypothetical protein